MYGLFVFEENFYHKSVSYKLVGVYDTEEESTKNERRYEAKSTTEVFTLKLLGKIVMFEHTDDGSFLDSSWYSNVDEIKEDGWEENESGDLEADYYNPEFQTYGITIVASPLRD